jgi:fumarate hydratase class II
MKNHKVATDSFGKIKVPPNSYWGAQTQRALLYFQIGQELMPNELIISLALIKKAAAKVNFTLNKLVKQKAKYIDQACDEIIAGYLNHHFPLTIWQSGSATQTNMNLNEVIANRAAILATTTLKQKIVFHPNDDINMSQSTNDIFPTAMHITTQILLIKKLLPALSLLRQKLFDLSKKFKCQLKIGRTHLQDALPMSLGQEFSGYVAQIDLAINNIKSVLPALQNLAIGGTAIGTGLNAPKQFGSKMANELARLTGLKLKSAANKFSIMAAHDALLMTSSALKTLATALYKIVNDIRWLACGPNCGLGELILPSNEPGSSIMPGKVNPTQCEVMLMLCSQVIGNDAVISFANSQGNFELNVFKPVIIYNLIQAIHLLSDGCISFSHYALQGIKANKKQLDSFVNKSLMLATVLNPIIGYDNASKVVNYAQQNNLTLRQACTKLGYLTSKAYDRLIKTSYPTNCSK